MSVHVCTHIHTMRGAVIHVCPGINRSTGETVHSEQTGQEGITEVTTWECATGNQRGKGILSPANSTEASKYTVFLGI